MRALLIGALLLFAGGAQEGPRELEAITAPGGAATAHWLGVPPTLDK